MPSETADNTIQQAKVQLSQSGRWSVHRTRDKTKRRRLHEEPVGTLSQRSNKMECEQTQKKGEHTERIA